MEGPGPAVAPATATDSGGNTASAPLTFEQAFAADASPASDSSAQTTTPPAAVQPASAPEPTPAPEDRSPFIPRSRFDEVNTRLKAAETWKQQYGWLEQAAQTLTQQEFQEFVAKARRINADPIAHLEELIAEVQAHPQHGQRLKSLAAKALAARSGTAQPQMPEPDVVITDAAGNVVGQGFSAKATAALVQHHVSQALAAHKQELAPIVQTHEKLAKQAQADHDKAEGEKFASGFTAELQTLYPSFDTHKKAVGEEVVRMLAAHATDPRVNEPSFLEAITLRAAHKVIGAAERSTTESRVLDSLQQQAAASSSVNPGSAAPSTAKRPRDFFDASLSWK